MSLFVLKIGDTFFPFDDMLTCDIIENFHVKIFDILTCNFETRICHKYMDLPKLAFWPELGPGSTKRTGINRKPGFT